MGDGLMTSKETFKQYPVESKLDTLFDFSVAIYEQSCTKQEDCEDRFRKLEKRKWFDKGLSAGTGFIGGVVAILGSLKLKLF